MKLISASAVRTATSKSGAAGAAVEPPSVAAVTVKRDGVLTCTGLVCPVTVSAKAVESTSGGEHKRQSGQGGARRGGSGRA